MDDIAYSVGNIICDFLSAIGAYSISDLICSNATIVGYGFFVCILFSFFGGGFFFFFGGVSD